MTQCLKSWAGAFLGTCSVAVSWHVCPLLQIAGTCFNRHVQCWNLTPL